MNTQKHSTNCLACLAPYNAQSENISTTDASTKVSGATLWQKYKKGEKKSRNPISKTEHIENYDEEYVINCMIPLLEFINNYGSITGKMNSEA